MKRAGFTAAGLARGVKLWRARRAGEAARPTLPSHVIVGYRTYRIEEWSPVAASGAGNFGEACHSSAMIRVRCDLDAAEVGNTLLHEILHCCWRDGALANDDDQERVVTVLANQLMQVWRDNPAVVAFLSAAVGHEAV
jgi:hypothetical protein